MKVNSIILLITTFLACSCSGYNKQDSKCKILDLDSLQTVNTDFSKEFISHKNFDTLNEIDTIRLSKTLICVKKAVCIQEGTNDYQPDIIYSNVSVYEHNKVLFRIDSILTVGMYCYNDSLNLLTIPIIRSQDSESFQTESDIYLCNTESGTCEKINKIPILNSSYALVAPDGKSLIFSDANVLYIYDVKSKLTKPIAEFSNPSISIFKLAWHDNIVNIYYFDNFTDYIYNNTPMKKASLNFPDSCFNS